MNKKSTEPQLLFGVTLLEFESSCMSVEELVEKLDRLGVDDFGKCTIQTDDGCSDIQIVGQRLETPEEVSNRINYHKKQDRAKAALEATILERERTEYYRLRKKFGGINE